MTDSKISFSKEIAESIGLGEAIILEQINQSSLQNKTSSLDNICSNLSFINPIEIEELLTKLVKIGLIVEQKINKEIVFSLKRKEELNRSGKWLPNQEILDQINEYGIPEDFAHSQIEDFNKLSNERDSQESNWGIKFLRFVIKKWRFKEAEDNKKKKRKQIDKDWVPDLDAKEILINSGIDEEFLLKELPEFIMYWRERKEESDIWNSKFIAHIRRRWGRISQIKEIDDLPSKMTSNWTPNEDFFDILALTDIPREFAEKIKPEFIMYWKENGQSLTSWNSKFLQHVKYNWERNNNDENKEHKKQLENRIESSWKIEEKPIMKSSSPQSSEKTRENFKKLKEKYQI